MSPRNQMRHFGMSAALLVGTSLSSPLLIAQSSGSVVGTVSDVTGAVVPGATVKLTNVATADVRTAQTNQSGEYRFVSLPATNYTVQIESPQFKTFQQTSFAVPVDSSIRIDAQLQLGPTTEVVEVSTQAPLLQTESGTVSTQVEGKVVDEMPLNGRNSMNLLALTPGVVPGANTSGSAPLNASNHTTVTGFNNYSIAGGQNGYSSDYLDGAPDNLLGQNSVGLIVTQDAIQEFKVSSNAVSAEFGRFGGGIIEFVTKSGGNSFHGTVYEYFRNKVLNANYFLSKASIPILPRNKFNQNQYGATITGPVIKDKLFFMGSWENFALRTAAPVSTNVPTTAQLSGVFNKKITDPSGKCPITQDGSGNYVIPSSCFDVAGKALLGYFPTTGANQPAGATSNYVATPVTGDNAKQYNGRLDYNLGTKQRIFGRYTYWGFDDIGQNLFQQSTVKPALDSTYGSTHLYTHGIVLGDTITLNPTTVADVRVSYLRQTLNNFSTNIFNKADYSAFGPGYTGMASQFTFKQQPNIQYNGGVDALYGVTAAGAVQLDRYGLYTLNASLTKIIGNHSLKFGGEGRLGLFNSVANYPQYAGLSTYSPTGIGDEIAAMLLGIYQTDQIFTVIPTTTFNYSYAAFGTDTWRVNRGLTVTLGLRYELPGGMEEKKDRNTVLLPNQIDPVTGYKGTVALVNSSLWNSRSTEPGQYRLFSPRVSFAQQLSNNMVVRGGYALMYLPPDLSGGVLPPYASPIVAASTTTSNTLSATAGQSVISYRQANPFPNGVIQPFGRTNPNFTQSLTGQVVTGAVPNSRYPYMQQWNVAIQNQLPGEVTFSLAYVGTKGTHLPVNATNGTPPSSIFGLDQLNPSLYDSNPGDGALYGTAVGGAFAGRLITAQVACPALGGQTTSVGQCLKPYPQYKDVQDWTHNTASSTYNALYLTFQKRFGGGGTLNANYVWFKSIDDVNGYQNFYDVRSARGISSFDVPHRFVASYVVDLPFGKGKRFAHFGGVGGALVSGWSVNGITTYAVGGPSAFTVNGGNTLITGAFVGSYGSIAGANTRANLVPGCNLKTSGSNYSKFINKTPYFNTSCVTNPGAYSFGNAPKATFALSGPATKNYDFSLVKSTNIKDKANLQFRMEAFNLFNRTQFTAPSDALGNKNFGIFTAVANTPRLLQASLRVKF